MQTTVGTVTAEEVNLTLAVKSGDMEAIREAVASFGSAGLRNTAHYRVPPIEVAATCGHVEALEYLLEAGADPELCDGDGNPPIFHAIREGHVEIVELLLAAGVDVKRCSHGWSLLHAAVNSGGLDMVQCMVEGAVAINLDEPVYAHLSPLSLAAKLGNTGIARFLVEAGADIENPRHCPPLIHALERRNVETAR